jgi:predicted GIY-YIG superfamily endonuclease
MLYVYVLRSVSNSEQVYVGLTVDVQQRLEVHNSGGSIYTKNLRPWSLVIYTAFNDEIKAKEFEKYLKSHAGRAFGAKHLW